MARYESWMRHAVALARAHPPPADELPAGALVYDADGVLCGSGWHARPGAGDPTAVAEIMAIRAAAAAVGNWRLTGTTVVTTLEPGVTGAGALVLARVRRLVMGSWDPCHGAICSQWDLVRDPRLNHRVEVVSGVLTTETDPLIQAHLAAYRQR